MILKTLLAAIAGVAAWKLTANRRNAAPRRIERKPHAENLWEGEGGALRDSGAQLGPQPSVVKPA